MDDEYGATYLTITDEDGVDYEMEILDEVELDGQLYYAMVSVQEADEESETEEVVILKVVEEDGEEVLATPDSEEEIERVFQIFMDRLYEGEDSSEAALD